MNLPWYDRPFIGIDAMNLWNIMRVRLIRWICCFTCPQIAIRYHNSFNTTKHVSKRILISKIDFALCSCQRPWYTRVALRLVRVHSIDSIFHLIEAVPCSWLTERGGVLQFCSNLGSYCKGPKQERRSTTILPLLSPSDHVCAVTFPLLLYCCTYSW